MSDAIRFLNDLRSRKLNPAGDPRDWSVDRLVEHAGEIGYSFSQAELREAYGHLWRVESIAFRLREQSIGRAFTQEN